MSWCRQRKVDGDICGTFLREGTDCGSHRRKAVLARSTPSQAALQDAASMEPFAAVPTVNPEQNLSQDAQRNVRDAEYVRRVIGELRGHDSGDGFYPSVPTFLQVFQPKRWSGHKLHIACDNAEQVADAVEQLWDVAEKRGMGMKAASAHLMEPPPKFQTHDLEQKFGQYRDKPFTKGVTVTLPRHGTLDEDTEAIVEALRNHRATSTVEGDSHVSGPVYHRFELAEDSGRDITDYNEYRSLYKEVS